LLSQSERGASLQKRRKTALCESRERWPVRKHIMRYSGEQMTVAFHLHDFFLRDGKIVDWRFILLSATQAAALSKQAIEASKQHTHHQVVPVSVVRSQTVVNQQSKLLPLAVIGRRQEKHASRARGCIVDISETRCHHCHARMRQQRLCLRRRHLRSAKHETSLCLLKICSQLTCC